MLNTWLTMQNLVSFLLTISRKDITAFLNSLRKQYVAIERQAEMID